jgi:hypothetical protein
LAACVLLSGVFLLAGSNPLQVTASTGVVIVLLSIVVSFLETSRRRERAFLANLGVRPFMLGMLFAAPAVVGEVAWRLGGAALR